MERCRQGYIQSTAEEIQETITELFTQVTKKSQLANKIKKALKIAEQFGIIREKKYDRNYKTYFFDSAVEEFLMSFDNFRFLEELLPNNPGVVFRVCSWILTSKNWISSGVLEDKEQFKVSNTKCNRKCNCSPDYKFQCTVQGLGDSGYVKVTKNKIEIKFGEKKKNNVYSLRNYFKSKTQ